MTEEDNIALVVGDSVLPKLATIPDFEKFLVLTSKGVLFAKTDMDVAFPIEVLSPIEAGSRSYTDLCRLLYPEKRGTSCGEIQGVMQEFGSKSC